VPHARDAEKFAPAFVTFITKHRVSRRPHLIACRIRDDNPLNETPVSNQLEKCHEHPLDILPLAIKRLPHQNNPVIANRKVQSAAEQDQHEARVQTSVRVKSLPLQDKEGREAPGKPAWKVLIAIQVAPQAAEDAQGRPLAQPPGREVYTAPSSDLMSFTDLAV